MATTTDLAPTRRKSSSSRAASKAREVQLEEQVAKLQDDIKAIGNSLARLSSDKVSEVKDVAKSQAESLQKQGQQVVEDVQEKASDIEKQLKDTIREKPLTAVAAAAGIGFVLALLTRH
jgi:ElaB/YqjD/DUF883 family membrane-anchored ribosome-binding protein